MKEEMVKYALYLGKKLSGRAEEIRNTVVCVQEGYCEDLIEDFGAISDEFMEVLKQLAVDIIF
jgi:hypothetical protein